MQWRTSDDDQWTTDLLDEQFWSPEAPTLARTQWCISDDDQWITDLLDDQFWSVVEEEPEPVPAPYRDARPYTEDEKQFDYTDDDNDIMELVSLILLMVE